MPVTPRAMLPDASRAAVWRNVPVLEGERVAFIRIDDGYDEDPLAPPIVEAGLTVTPFVNYYAAGPHGYPPKAEDQPHFDYLKRFTTPTRGVQSHAKQHHHLPGLPYAEQYDLISKGKTFLANANAFGVTPKLFAPPYGEYDDNTLLAARAAGFLVLCGWTHNLADLTAGKPVRPGDIILLHFTTTLSADLTLAADALVAADLEPGRLEDWLK